MNYSTKKKKIWDVDSTLYNLIFKFKVKSSNNISTLLSHLHPVIIKSVKLIIIHFVEKFYEKFRSID